jgi:hypothetical protein
VINSYDDIMARLKVVCNVSEKLSEQLSDAQLIMFALSMLIARSDGGTLEVDAHALWEALLKRSEVRKINFPTEIDESAGES